MEKLNFRATLLLANQIYKKSFKVTFLLAFMLSFISEYTMVYMLNHGLAEFIQNQGEEIPANFPSSDVILLVVLTIIFATIFVYGMVTIVQGIFIKQDNIGTLDCLKISLQIFAKRVFSFLGIFLLSMIAMTILSAFFRYIGIFMSVMLFLTTMPAVLLGSDKVFDSISKNFAVIKRDFFFMFKVAFVVLALMTLKPVIIVAMNYLLDTMQADINTMGMSVENIIMTITDALIIPYIFAISVATYLISRSK